MDIEKFVMGPMAGETLTESFDRIIKEVELLKSTITDGLSTNDRNKGRAIAYLSVAKDCIGSAKIWGIN